MIAGIYWNVPSADKIDPAPESTGNAAESLAKKPFSKAAAPAGTPDLSIYEDPPWRLSPEDFAELIRRLNTPVCD